MIIFFQKSLLWFFWIGILAGMATHFYGFNWLAACVAAVVSESKKAVSAVAAAVVGIGLFLAPMEKAQAQLSGSGMATVSQVNLSEFSFGSADDLVMSLYLVYGSGMTVVLDTFYWSGIYGDDEDWSWISVTGTREDFRTYRASHFPVQTYYYPGNRSDYYVCRFGYVDFDAPVGGGVSGYPIDEDLGWVEVWVWTGNGGYGSSGPSAYVYDSDGNFYYVDLSIDGYVISGPSLD